MKRDTHGGPLSALEAFLADERQHRISLSGTGAVYRLEKRFASLVGQPHALAVSNATMGLWAIFMALGIRDADVVATPYTWGGSLAGLLHTGNRPVFADIDRESLTLNPEQVSRAITRKTKAILAVDVYGYPCDGPALREIADRHGLWLIQDCAQSFGALIGRQHTGCWADVSVFSFTAGKALWAGEGGMIVSRHQQLYDQLIWRTQHPLRQIRDLPDCSPNELALNLRIHPFAAVWAEAGFAQALEAVWARRQEAIRLLGLLQAEQTIGPGTPDPRIEPSYHLLTCEPCVPRSRFDRVLKAAGYRTEAPPIVEPLYAHDGYRHVAGLHGWRPAARCRVADRQCRQRVRLMRVSADHRAKVCR